MFFKLFVFLLFLSYPSLADPQKSSCQLVIVGAGIGGIYTAWRLAVDSSTIPGSEICIFEAKPRPGGRILTVTDPVPGFEGFTVDLGAYRFDRVSHRHTRLLTENVLGIQTLCYTDPLKRSNDTCGVNNRPIVGTRGVIFGLGPNGTNADTALSSYSNINPYRIPKKFQWGPQKPLDSPRDPYDLLLGKTSVVKEIADRWDELTSETDYVSAMRIADEIIASIRKGNYRGIPYSEVSLLQAAVKEGFKQEEIAFYFDTSVFIDEQFYTRISLEQLGSLFIRKKALAVDKSIGEPRSAVTPVKIRNGVPRRIGMKSILDALLQQNKEAGVKIFYNAKVVSLRRERPGYPQVQLGFKDGTFLTVSKVVLNIGKPDLIALGVGSEPLFSSGEPFRRAVERNFVSSLSKTYCFWEDAWWLSKMGTSAGQSRTADDNFYSMRYHDGDFECADRETLKDCRGGLLVSYIAGDPSGAGAAIHPHTHNELGYTPLTNTDNVRTLLTKNVTGVEQLYIEDLVNELRRFHKTSLKSKGFEAKEAIGNPVGCIFADWRDVGIHFHMGPGKGDLNMYKRFARPAVDLDISLVNEAWGQDQGWAESSLNSAERALFHEFKLDKPQWMDKAYHVSVIKMYNRGEEA